jgi:hypothetical protein
MLCSPDDLVNFGGDVLNDIFRDILPTENSCYKESEVP